MNRVQPFEWLDMDTALEPRIDVPAARQMLARHQSLANMYETDLNKTAPGMDPLGQGVKRELARCLMLVHQNVAGELQALLR